MSVIVIKYDGGDSEAIFNVARAKISDYRLYIKYLDGKKEIIKIFNKTKDEIVVISSIYANDCLLWNLYELEHEKNLAAIEEEDER